MPFKGETPLKQPEDLCNLELKSAETFGCPTKTSLDLFKRATWPGGSVAFVTLCNEQAIERLVFLVLVVPGLLTTVQNPSSSFSLPSQGHDLTRRSLCSQLLLNQITKLAEVIHLIITSIHRKLNVTWVRRSMRNLFR